MKPLDFAETLSAVAIAHGKPAVYLSINTHSVDGDFAAELEMTLAAAPYLRDMARFGQLIADGYGYVVCESEEEMLELYEQTVGDDGPTARNPYRGNERGAGNIYVLTCDASGKLLNENT